MEIRTPAFWDLHIHGVSGIDFMHASSREMIEACEVLGRHGIGAFAPTLLTADPKLLEDACARWGRFLFELSHAVASGGRDVFFSRTAAIPVGLHLEGPFLSPKMAGAHPAKRLRKPSLSYAWRLFERARGQIAIMTVAPELPGAPELIRKLTRMGIRVQIGHTAAEAAVINRACRCGATGVTHLFNAMMVHHRAPGVLSALAQGRLTAEIITDGIHVESEFLRYTASAIGSRLYGVSDACSALGAPAQTALTLGSLKVRRQGDAAYVGGARAGLPSAPVLAGGATWLTSHPARLLRSWKRSQPTRLPSAAEVFPIFYRIPSRLFPRKARLIRHRGNRFRRSDWKFLGSY
ncbi:MAG: hypothetical protein HYW49_09920 [Deltaproteobacteria bacterium]|nr:hypothetical protein [Deltaproteobacteria bacterium]